jgi:hypothetical protein
MARRATGEVEAAVRKELQQAKDEARLAERRYEAVDPEKGLVAAELESRWESALRQVEDIDRRLEDLAALARHEHSVDEAAINSLARDLHSTWNAPSASMRTKQRIVRILVEEIVADVDDENEQVVLFVHWAGGRHTELRVARNRAGPYMAGTRVNAVETVRKMASRWSDRKSHVP